MEKRLVKGLARSDLFQGINEEEINKLLICLEPSIEVYKKKELISRQGESFSKIGLLLSGRANIVNERASGQRIVMETIGPGDLFGEVAAFAGQASWPATVESRGNTEIVFICKNRIVSACEFACKWHQKLTVNFVSIISDKALALSNKIEYLTIKSMRGKINFFLLNKYLKNNKSLDFDIGMNRNEMADFLNVSRPSLSRELKRMKEEKIIDFHLSYFKILDLNRLEEN